MILNLSEMKENLIDVKESLTGGNPQEALATISDIENQLLLLKNQPSFTKDIQEIKDSIAKTDLKKALYDLTKVQTALLKAETEMLKAQITNPQMMLSQQNMNNAQEDYDNDEGDNNYLNLIS